MKFLIDDKEYEVVIQKKNNKNTYIRVKEDLKIYWTPETEKKILEGLTLRNYKKDAALLAAMQNL